MLLKILNLWRTDAYFNPDKKSYEFLGLKYTNGKYGIDQQAYEALKHETEKTQKDGSIICTPIGKNSEFLFSLYKNERIRLTDNTTGEVLEALYGALNNDGSCAIKPIHKRAYAQGGRKYPYYW